MSGRSEKGFHMLLDTIIGIKAFTVHIRIPVVFQLKDSGGFYHSKHLSAFINFLFLVYFGTEKVDKLEG